MYNRRIRSVIHKDAEDKLANPTPPRYDLLNPDRRDIHRCYIDAIAAEGLKAMTSKLTTYLVWTQRAVELCIS